jgi:hypothetical protein
VAAERAAIPHRDDARANISDYIERFCNPKRRHPMLA